MYLYIDLEEEVKSCNLPDATTTETAIYCDIEYLITKQKIIMFACLQKELELIRCKPMDTLIDVVFNNLPQMKLRLIKYLFNRDF